MDRHIFNLKASTEATSLYILICALMDMGQSPTLPEVRAKWNGDEESLHAAVKELMRRGVLEAAHSLSDEETLNVRAMDDWS